jgi:hypothetical protein
MPEITPVGAQAGPWVRQMLYAYPGWRKTSFIGTFPEAGFKTLLIRSGVDQIPARILKSGVDEVVVSTWEDLTGGDGVENFLRMSDHGYDWVWWDCVSIDQDVLLDDIWEATIAEKPHRNNLTPTGGRDRGEYGRNMERIQQFVRHVVGSNSFHFGMTAHPFEDQHPTNDEGGSLLVPYIQGKGMVAKISGYCNVIAFQELKEKDDQTWARQHYRENSRFYAKDLYDAFDRGFLDNPTAEKFMTAIDAAKAAQGITENKRPQRRGARRGAAASPKPAGRRGRREQ